MTNPLSVLRKLLQTRTDSRRYGVVSSVDGVHAEVKMRGGGTARYRTQVTVSVGDSVAIDGGLITERLGSRKFLGKYEV